MSIALFATSLLFSRTPQVVDPVLWLNPNGRILVEGKAVNPRFAAGARVIRTNHGATYDFDGRRGGIHFPDLRTFHWTSSMTIALWINPRSYVNDGPGAQILFRGDDRNGLDPYSMVIHSDGTINFGISNEQGLGMGVSTELPLNRWSQVVANWDEETGFIKLWLDGDLVATSRTTRKPFAILETQHTPGVGIGHVQNEFGPHNQPFNGMIADLRFYHQALSPEEIGFNQNRFDPPQKSSAKLMR